MLDKFSWNGVLPTFNLLRAVFKEVNEVVEELAVIGVLAPLVGMDSTGVWICEFLPLPGTKFDRFALNAPRGKPFGLLVNACCFKKSSNDCLDILVFRVCRL